MTELNATLEAIGKELTGLFTAPAQPAAVDMTLGEFVTYCKSQIDLAKSDTDSTVRLAELCKVFEIAKMHGWEETDTMSVSIFSGDLSVESQSASAERLAPPDGQSLSVPGGQAAPASGAFEGASGPTGPASNTAKPAARYMPPAFPQTAPASSGEGWMAKAAEFKAHLAKAAGGAGLIAEFEAMLANEPAQVGDTAPTQVSKDDGWPGDLATESFLEGKQAHASEDYFGTDPNGLGRGVQVD